MVNERLLVPPSSIGVPADRPSAVGSTLTTVTLPVYSAEPPSSSSTASLTERVPSSFVGHERLAVAPAAL